MPDYVVDIGGKVNRSFQDSLGRLQTQVKGVSSATDRSNAATDRLPAAQRRAARALRTTRSALRDHGSATKLATAANVSLIASFAGQAIGLIRRFGGALISVVDDMARFTSGVSLSVDSSAEFAKVQNQLFEVANETGITFQAAGKSFLRFRSSLKSTGQSSADTIKIVRTLANTARLYGIDAAQLAGVSLQLNQALSSGVLRGEEFNAILDGMPPLARALEQALNKTTKQLRAMAEQGKITSDIVLRALAIQAESNAAQMGNLTRTVDQASNALKNNLSRAVTDVLKQLGFRSGLISLLDAATIQVKRFSGFMQELARSIRQVTAAYSLLYSQLFGANDLVAAIDNANLSFVAGGGQYLNILKKQIVAKRTLIKATDDESKAVVRERERRAEVAKQIARNNRLLQDTTGIERETVLQLGRSQVSVIRGERLRSGRLQFAADALKTALDHVGVIEDQNKALDEQERRLNRIATVRSTTEKAINAIQDSSFGTDQKVQFAGAAAGGIERLQADTGNFTQFEEQRQQLRAYVTAQADARKAGIEARRASAKAATEAEAANRRAIDTARLAAEVVGTSLVDAFSNVTQAAQIFGSRWSSVVSTVVNQIGRLIATHIALRAAQKASAASGTSISPAAAISPQIALAVAGIAIASSVLATLLSDESEQNKKAREASVAAAEARAGAEQQAFQQRQEIIGLERRQVVAAEQSKFLLAEAQRRAEIAAQQRDRANVRAFQNQQESAFRRGATIVPPSAPALPRNRPIQIAFVDDRDDVDSAFSERGDRVILDLTDRNQEDIRSILGIPT